MVSFRWIGRNGEQDCQRVAARTYCLIGRGKQKGPRRAPSLSLEPSRPIGRGGNSRARLAEPGSASVRRCLRGRLPSLMKVSDGLSTWTAMNCRTLDSDFFQLASRLRRAGQGGKWTTLVQQRVDKRTVVRPANLCDNVRELSAVFLCVKPPLVAASVDRSPLLLAHPSCDAGQPRISWATTAAAVVHAAKHKETDPAELGSTDLDSRPRPPRRVQGRNLGRDGNHRLATGAPKCRSRSRERTAPPHCAQLAGCFPGSRCSDRAKLINNKLQQ